MAEWSEYFEEFPEENPANYDAEGRPLDRAESERLRIANEKLDVRLRIRKPRTEPPSRKS